MNNQEKQQLAVKAASKIHQAWCNAELQAFYGRLKAALKEGTLETALKAACMKNGKPRNEVEIDAEYMALNEVAISKQIETFEGFKELVDAGYIVVKRFASRTLTAEEQVEAGSNYKTETKEENILRPFEELSAHSQDENLKAAISAVAVYEEYAKRGATIAMMQADKSRAAIGTLIHADWMARNKGYKNENNEHLFVPYDRLDEWTKGQDLDVFNEVLTCVHENLDKYFVEKEEGLEPIKPLEREKEVLASIYGARCGV